MHHYHKIYTLLGANPGDSWQNVRKAYKSAVRKWHPDRYVRDDAKKKVAEEMAKKINMAFQELEEYFRQYGHLPLDAPDHTNLYSNKGLTAATAGQPDFAGHNAEAPQDPTFSSPPQNRARRHWLGLIFIAIPFGFLVLSPGEKEPQDHPESEDRALSSFEGPILPSSSEETRKYFTIGSSVGEVHSIQGIPTRIEGNTWYYKDAKVIFLNGKVSDWTDSDGNRLHAQFGIDLQNAEKTVFSRGATKAEVRAVQGIPLRETPHVWEYGISRVYFDGEKVVGWQESPLDPLRIAR